MNENNFCYHPWVGLDISPQGEIRPCCKYESAIATTVVEYQSSLQLQQLKQDFLQGEKPSSCQRCWNDERAGIMSKRQLDWQYVFNKQKPNINHIKIISLPFGNSCNLACRICDSYASSSWIAEGRKLQSHLPDIKIYEHQRFYQDKKFLQEIKNICSNLIHVEFPGGEPFLAGVNEHLEFLDFLIEHGSKDISLHYTTNTTIFPNQNFWDRWQNFKKIDIQLSIDGIGTNFEYQRWPAKWNECLNNINKYISLRDKTTNIQLSVSHTVSIFNVYYLPEFVEWCKSNRLETPYLGMLSNPKYYNIKSFPKKIKTAISKKISRFNFENVVSYMNSEDYSDEFITSIKMINLLDNQRNQKFSETFTELYQLLKESKCQI